MQEANQTLIAVDAAAKGPYAAFGAVILCPDGIRLEVSGPLPRTALQEVTAALVALRCAPVHPGAVTIYVDAHSAELQSFLAVTHPDVHVVQILRNSIPEHQRAHELAQAARRKLEPARGTAPDAGDPPLAVYVLQSVNQGNPRYAVVYWEHGVLRGHTGSVPTQPTRALTRQALEAAVAQHVSANGYTLVLDARAYLKFMTPDVWATAAQLKTLRKKVRGLLVGQPLTDAEQQPMIEGANGDDPVSTVLAES